MEPVLKVLKIFMLSGISLVIGLGIIACLMLGSLQKNIFEKAAA
jgi:hypothetical protein